MRCCSLFNRKSTFFGLILLGLILWGIFHLLFGSIGPTSYWGVGGASVLAFIYTFFSAAERYGWRKSIVLHVVLLSVFLGAQALNAVRGWPFGFLIHHDILGWRFAGVVWPIPVFWSALGAGILMLLQRNPGEGDPRVLFSWCFDASLGLLLFALLLEPLLQVSTLVAWSAAGQLLGVPFTALLGWFISGMIAFFLAVLLGRLWERPSCAIPAHLPFVFFGFCGIVIAWAGALSLPAVQFLGGIGFFYFGFQTYRLFCKRKKGCRSISDCCETTSDTKTDSTRSDDSTEVELEA